MDSRQGSNKKFPLADLLRQSVYSRLAGYEDLNDAVRVSADPTFRSISSKKNWDRGGALTSRLQSFETEMLASEDNLLGLMAVNRELVAQAETQDDSERVVLDMDSTESPVHGQQEGSAYNGHFESVCYHPLLLFNQHGDCLAAKLRPGNVHSAKDWNELLLPEIERQQAAGKQVTPGAMRPLLSQRFMSLRRNAECSTPFAFRPTRAWNWRLRHPVSAAGRAGSQAVGALQERRARVGESRR